MNVKINDLESKVKIKDGELITKEAEIAQLIKQSKEESKHGN